MRRCRSASHRPRACIPARPRPPVGLAPGAEVTAELRWTAGDVSPGGRRYTTAAVTVAFAAAKVGSPLAGDVCGPAMGATFGQTWLKPDAQLRSRWP